MTKNIEICLIDDERIVCDRLRPILEKCGYEVETFTDSKAALERLAQKKFDILISDVKMPHVDGLELMRYARSHSPETRVVIITGFATVETAREAMKGGAVDFIAKPFRLNQLRDLIASIAEEIQSRSSHAPGFSPATPPPE